MAQTIERFLPPDFLFPTVEGMHDTDKLLRAVGRESAHAVLQPNTVGAAVMNGSVIPLVYAASAAMENGQFDIFANRIVFFGSSKVGEEITLHPHISVNDPSIIIIEDIADKLGVLGAFERQFSNTHIQLFAPVQKPHTSDLHQKLDNGSDIKTVLTIDDVWVDSGCGMDEGLTFPGVNSTEQDYLTVLQRCSRVGVYTNGHRTFDQRIAFFERQLLPWVSSESPLFELMMRMEENKRTNDPNTVLEIVPEIMPTIETILRENPYLYSL